MMEGFATSRSTTMDPVHFIPARTLPQRHADPDRFYDENGCEWRGAFRWLSRAMRRIGASSAREARIARAAARS